jgi:hypothetical protein
MTPKGRSKFITACLVAAGLSVCASPASAAIPATATEAEPVAVLSGGQKLGDMRFTTSYDSARASGTATSTALRLQSGVTYRIRTCVWFKGVSTAPETVCEETQPKPNFLSALTGIAAPAAHMTVPRPAVGHAAATIAGTVLVDKLVGGGWAPLASSWPADGMPAAGVAVPAVDQLDGAVLAPQGSALAGTRRGGINTRAQDSICREDSSPGTGPRGSTTALGDLPFPYEVQEPSGTIRGTMILLHGGGWYLAGRGVMEGMRGDADRWLARGWRTVNSSYRACATSIADVASLFDRVLAVYGKKTPICADGQSSGGHLALLLSAVRSRLACVEAQGAPADLQALPGQREGTASSEGPIKVANMAVAAFGEDLMARVSPTRVRVKARVLFALAAQDTAIPYAQAKGFAAAQKARDHDAYVDPIHLGAGSVPWIHGLVSTPALNDLHNREKKLVAPLVNATVSAPASVRIASLRRSGLRVRYSCPNSCSVTVRLTLAGHTIASAKARRSAYGAGKLTLRLGAAARKRATAGRARVVADVKTSGSRKRVARAVSVRR